MAEKSGCQPMRSFIFWRECFEFNDYTFSLRFVQKKPDKPYLTAFSSNDLLSSIGKILEILCSISFSQAE